jgi:hypothetical protein
MYSIDDSKGRLIGRSKTKATAHRVARRAMNAAFVHTIRLEHERRSKSTTASSTRKSEKRYVAVLVATTTAKSLRLDAEHKAVLEKQLAEAKSHLASLMAKLKMTVKQADAQHDREYKRWMAEKEATDNRLRPLYGYTTERILREDMLKRGFADPNDESGPYGIVLANEAVENINDQLRRWAERVEPVLGGQTVLSWHSTVDHAQKALSSHLASKHLALGDDLDVRTDIKVAERK